MRYHIRHITALRYDGMVRLARMNLRLQPAPWPGQTLHDFALLIEPRPALIEQSAGAWVVNRHRITLREPLARLTIESRVDVEVTARPIDPALAPDLASLRKAALESADLSAMGPASYLYASPMAATSADIAAWAAPFFDGSCSVLEAGHRLMGAIHSEFRYDGSATQVDTPAQDAFVARHGVCQDFAHVMIVAARAHGIPAAYISGYLRTIPPAGKPRLIGADATHAWAALWCGKALGWVGFDPTNDVLAGTDHIFTAMGRDYADVAPIDGVVLGGGRQRIEVSVDVAPVD